MDSLGGILISRVLGEPQFKVIDDSIKKIVKIAVFELFDPYELDVAKGIKHDWQAWPISKWCDSEVGNWVLSRALETPVVVEQMDYEHLKKHYVVTVKLYEEDAVYYKLKWC